MRIFVTGATGFVGSAIVQDLLVAGHQVLGLSRSDTGMEALTAAGAQAYRGDITDLDSIRRGAEGCDGIIHTAFNHDDFSKFKESTENDRRLIEALGEVLAGSERPLIVTSGVGILSSIGRLATEADKPATSPNPRIASEEAVDAVAAKGVKAAVMRLPPSVHGKGEHGFIPMLIGIAREKGISVYSDRMHNWCSVHQLDAARCYKLAIEQKDMEPGTRYHAIAEEHIPFKNIAEIIGKRLNLPIVEKPAEEAARHFGWFAHFAAMDITASSKMTRERLGWNPTHIGLLADIDSEAYFPA